MPNLLLADLECLIYELAVSVDDFKGTDRKENEIPSVAQRCWDEVLSGRQWDCGPDVSGDSVNVQCDPFVGLPGQTHREDVFVSGDQIESPDPPHHILQILSSVNGRIPFTDLSDFRMHDRLSGHLLDHGAVISA